MTCDYPLLSSSVWIVISVRFKVHDNFQFSDKTRLVSTQGPGQIFQFEHPPPPPISIWGCTICIYKVGPALTHQGVLGYMELSPWSLGGGGSESNTQTPQYRWRQSLSLQNRPWVLTITACHLRTRSLLCHIKDYIILPWVLKWLTLDVRFGKVVSDAVA